MPTRIIYIDYDKSVGLEREIAAIQSSFAIDGITTSTHLAKHASLQTYLQEYLSTLEGKELQRQVDRWQRQYRVLDVGVGNGQSSIYLASKGHSVVAIEPSPDMCQLLEATANQYNFSFDIYSCNAESIKVLDREFDAVIFNSSLHHCDDPVNALRQCYQCLVEGGELLLVNEPILQFYRSKEWYYARLESHPQEMGHYGGNEHNYRYAEYINMLKLAGFSDIRSQPHLSVSDFNGRLQQAQLKLAEKKSLITSSILVAKQVYYFSLYRLETSGFIGKTVLNLLKHLSILPMTFIAKK